MKRSIQNIVFCALTIATATAAASLPAKANETVKADAFNVHQLRLTEFDARDKGYEYEVPSLHRKVTAMRDARNKADAFNGHQLRLTEFDARDKGYEYEVPSLHRKVTAQRDARNKAGDSLSTTPLMAQRQQLLDRGSK